MDQFNTQLARKALEVGLRQTLVAEFKVAEPKIDLLYNVSTTDRASETDVTYSDFTAMQELAEGEGIPYEVPSELFVTTYAPKKYGKGFRVTEEMREDDKNRVVARMIRALALSSAHTLGFSAWNTINNGHSSSYTGGDGKELFATDHPTAIGTYSNEPSTATNLSRTSVEQCMIDLMTTVDNDGKYTALQPKTLFIPPALWADADRIFGSAFEPNSANTATKNPIAGKLNVEVIPYLTNTKQWTVQCDNHELHWLWRKMLQFGNDGDFDTDDWKYKMKGRWVNGWTDGRGVYSSPGV